MSSAWLSAAIQEFEQVTLDNGTDLFRVRARARPGDDPEPRPVLVTGHQDGSAHTYQPLSSGGDRRGLLRLAYTVPTALVGPATAFALELPDGHRLALPAPAPGPSRAQPEHGQQRHDAGPPAEDAGVKPYSETGEQRTESPTQLERELAELRSANAELRRRLAAGAAGAAEHAASAASVGIVEAGLGSRRKAQADRDDALGVNESERNERDQALAQATAARAERDKALDATREAVAERDRLTGRLRQLQARNELLRADAKRTQPGADRRRLESEREQLATHVRALAELLSVDVGFGEASAAPDPAGVVVDGLATLRARAVTDANEQAEHELRRLQATTPR